MKRPQYNLPTFEDITSKLAGAKYLSVLDAISAFWQISLDEESSRLCTFSSPFGRFKFLRMVLAFFDPRVESEIVVNAFLFGLRAVLQQRGKPIAFASLTFTPTQRNYADIEKELLVVLYECKKFHQYVYGTNFKIYSDHPTTDSYVKNAFVRHEFEYATVLLAITVL
ncbi:hypothetical protein AVEN_68761-1 [Araneus ventricosus]|uniref:Reverse transcriptase RNase H-like domain-containing protein n=1 Tax=Araneus ventricosus TaxID=182803 RepID=A0A4Y2C556_ARAVE|nr:hypothetical protein AVEN_68761-1 [Araneus ventricosus]